MAKAKPQNTDPGRGYLALSTRPLHVLVFLLPLIVLYEAGTMFFLTDRARGVVETIRAHSILLGVFQEAGVVGPFLPGLALIAVLVAWQSIRRDPWRVRPIVLLGMAAECLAWTAPLFVLGGLIFRAIGGGGPGDGAAMAGMDLYEMSWPARLTIAVGAGLYEELLFRMIGIAAVHFLIVDLFRRSDDTGRWVAVTVTAAAFALYHEIATRGGINWPLFTLFTGAGFYLGWLFLRRGFGIVVGVHALYDALILVVIPALRSPTT